MNCLFAVVSSKCCLAFHLIGLILILRGNTMDVQNPSTEVIHRIFNMRQNMAFFAWLRYFIMVNVSFFLLCIYTQTAKGIQGASDVSKKWLIGDRWLSGHQVRLIYLELFILYFRLLGSFRWSLIKKLQTKRFSPDFSIIIDFLLKNIFPQSTEKLAV